MREAGYDAVTMDGIAARAGVGKATVYRRWSSKETLVVEALGRMLRAIPAPDTGTTRGDLLALLRVARAMYADPATGMLLSGLVAAMARSAPIAEAMRAGFVAVWQDAMRAVLRRAEARGDVRAPVDVALATDLLSAPFFYRFLMTGAPLDEPLAESIVDVVLRGLSSDRPRG